MAQVFQPRANAIVRIVFIGGACLAVAVLIMAVAFSGSPYVTGAESVPQQPVPFSHQHHVGGLGIDCRYCHTSVDRSSFAGIPDTKTCMTCHSQLWTNADMLAPVRESFTEDRPLAWKRVYDLPDYVYFNHQSHVNNGVGCESCHGRVDRMPLTQKKSSLSMKWCLDCHRNPGPELRPSSAITAMGFGDLSPDESGQLVAHFAIKTDRLIECMTCHR